MLNVGTVITVNALDTQETGQRAMTGPQKCLRYPPLKADDQVP